MLAQLSKLSTSVQARDSYVSGKIGEEASWLLTTDHLCKRLIITFNQSGQEYQFFLDENEKPIRLWQTNITKQGRVCYDASDKTSTYYSSYQEGSVSVTSYLHGIVWSSPTLQLHFYPNGRLQRVIENNTITSYHFNGQIQEERTMGRHGLVGEQTVYHRNGHIKQIAHWEDGKLAGVRCLYYPNTLPKCRMMYEGGKLLEEAHFSYHNLKPNKPQLSKK